MLYLKTKLTEIENIPMFSPRALTHGLEKRQAGEEEEGRGWKNKDKKKKKKDKKRKKKKEKVFIEEIEDHSDAAEEDEVVAEANAAVADPYTSGLQFSAYSSQPQPAYQPLPPQRAQEEYFPEPQPAREYSPGPQRAQEEYLVSPQPAPEDRAQYLYGLDSQGIAQYMDEAAIEEVLQTPQALKVRPHISVTVTPPILAGHDDLPGGLEVLRDASLHPLQAPGTLPAAGPGAAPATPPAGPPPPARSHS